MDEFDELLKNFDLEFFGKGRHKVSVEKALELFRDKKALIVDVRTKEEISHVRFDFAINIPDSNRFLFVCCQGSDCLYLFEAEGICRCEDFNCWII